MPYGSWPTPITSEVVVAQAVRLSDVQVDGGDLIWAESRPAEGGRTALVRRGADGSTTELLPRDANVRTAVHEYGGGAWWVRDGVVWYASWHDQRLYRRDPQTGRVAALTPEPERPKGDRYADGDLSPDGEWIVCVREHHPRGGGVTDVRNEIVRLAAHRPSAPEVLVTGPDFVSTPRFHSDGRRLCWLEWDHPNMPWDQNRLCVGGAEGEHAVIAGGSEESVSEPEWLPDGSLTFISDRTGWWNLYRWTGPGGEVEPLTELEAEIGLPQWVFGSARYVCLPDGRIVFASTQDGFESISVRLNDGAIEQLDLPFTVIHSLRLADADSVVTVASSPYAEAAVVHITLDGRAPCRRCRHCEKRGTSRRSAWSADSSRRPNRSSFRRRAVEPPTPFCTSPRTRSTAPRARSARPCSSTSTEARRPPPSPSWTSTSNTGRAAASPW